MSRDFPSSEDALLDMEEAASSSSELLPEAPSAPRASRVTVMGAVLGVVGLVAVATTIYSRPSFVQTDAIIGFSEDETTAEDIWASVLDDDAYQAFEASTTTTLAAATAAPTEAPTEEPTTVAPTVAPLPAATAAPTAPPTTAAPTAAPTTTAPPAPVVFATTAPAVGSISFAPAIAAAAVAAPTTAAPVSVTVDTSTIDTSSTAATLKTLSEQFLTQAQAAVPGSATYVQAMTFYNKLQGRLTAVSTPAVAQAPVVYISGAPTTTTEDPADSPLAPDEATGEGNACTDDEEPIAGTCYKKCADLTGGSHPIRTSPFSCCAAEPCSISNTWTHFGICSGYAVAGDAEAAENGKCANTQGACLTNEEMFGDMCYRKCSDLTNGQYPHRSAAMSCCKTTGLGCFAFTNVDTDASFAAGGGAGDGNSGTPGSGHPPLMGITTR